MFERLAAPLLPWLPDQGVRLLEQGGPLLWVIGAVSGLLWLLILERYWFLWVTHRGRLRIGLWTPPPPGLHPRIGRWLKGGTLSTETLALERGLGLIDALTQVLPLLGLLGTVQGMIEVFHVLALHGSGNARAMAGGISSALVTTLAGLVTALPGLYFGADLRQRVAGEVQRLRDIVNG